MVDLANYWLPLLAQFFFLFRSFGISVPAAFINNLASDDDSDLVIDFEILAAEPGEQDHAGQVDDGPGQLVSLTGKESTESVDSIEYICSHNEEKDNEEKVGKQVKFEHCVDSVVKDAIDEYDDKLSLYGSISENETIVFSFSSESDTFDTFVQLPDKYEANDHTVTIDKLETGGRDAETDDINTLLDAVHMLHTSPTAETER